MIIIHILIAALSVLGWIYILFRMGEKRTDWRVLLGGCFLGVLCAFFSLIIYEIFFFLFGPLLGLDPSGRILYYYLVNGPAEELSKFLAFLILFHLSRKIRQPMDGLLLAAATALGFAVAENVLYGMDRGLKVHIIRIFISAPGHMLYSAIWGFYYILYVFKKGLGERDRISRVFGGLLLASLFHSTYNTMVGLALGAGLIIDLISLIVALKMYHNFKRYSPYRYYKKSETREAIRNIGQVIKRNPRDAYLQMRFSFFLLQAGKYEKARMHAAQCRKYAGKRKLGHAVYWAISYLCSPDDKTAKEFGLYAKSMPAEMQVGLKKRLKKHVPDSQGMVLVDKLYRSI